MRAPEEGAAEGPRGEEWRRRVATLTWRMRKKFFRRKNKARRKRDENESVRSAFGRGVGFYIGEPCESTCNNILFHVYCNRSSGRCECMEHHPVNIDNRVCVRASRIGESCEFDDACAFSDNNAACFAGSCACVDGFRPAHHFKGATPICLPASAVTFLEPAYLMTALSAAAGVVLFAAILCLAMRIVGKSRLSRPADRLASAGSPPTMLSAFTGGPDSRHPSRSSLSSADYLPVSGRASYSVLHPSSTGSRRPSSASGLSFRTTSSFRGYRTSSREPVRRTLSSPADSASFPPSPCKAPRHHNSPVDEDDAQQDSSVPTVSVNHLSNHI